MRWGPTLRDGLKIVNSEMTNGLACFMTDLAGQRPNRSWRKPAFA